MFHLYKRVRRCRLSNAWRGTFLVSSVEKYNGAPACEGHRIMHQPKTRVDDAAFVELWNAAVAASTGARLRSLGRCNFRRETPGEHLRGFIACREVGGITDGA